MAGFGIKKQILLVGSDGVQLYVTRGKKTSLYEDFSDAGGNLSAALRNAFKEIKAPLTILLDVVEQQYRRETIPKVNFMDKNKVIQRKLMMAFPQQQMRAFLPSKQQPKEGDSMVALFAGLSPNLTVIQIMDAVLGSEIFIEACALLPVESVGLANTLKAAIHKKEKTSDRSRWSVLMTYHKTGGLRQIVTKDGELALTRITPLAIDPTNAESLASEMQREFAATQSYLSRFGYAPYEGLELMVVGSQSLLHHLTQYDWGVQELRALTTSDAAKLVGMGTVSDADQAIFGDILHAAWIGIQRKITMPLSSALMDKVTQARQISQLAIVVLVFALLGGAWFVFDTKTQNDILQADIVDIKSRRMALQSEYDGLAKKLNTLKYTPEQTKLGLDIYDEFSKRSLYTEPVLDKVIKAIDKGKVTLKNIKVVSTASTSIIDYLKLLASGTVPPMDNPDAQKAQMTLEMEIGFVPGTQVEEAARLTNQLVESLRTSFPNRLVVVDKMVGNLSIDKTVEGVSEQLAANVVEGRLVKEETSTIKLSGVAE